MTISLESIGNFMSEDFIQWII